MGMTGPENTLLPGELDSDGESPYLRRQKALAVRRSRVSHRLRWTLFTIAVLLPAGLAGYFVARFALSSPLFVLNSDAQVVITGNRFVSREEILNALALPLGGPGTTGVNIFRLALETRRKQVESIPWVQSAALTRVYPSRLVVHVEERTPVAFASMGGPVGLVDSQGVLLEKPENASFDFPVITGLEASGGLEGRRSRLAIYQEFMRQLQEESPRSGWLISEVNLADPDDLVALLIQGQDTILVHFGHKDFLDRFRNFLVLLPELRKSNAKLDSVDLRYRNQIVVNPQPSPPAQTAGTAPAARTMKE